MHYETKWQNPLDFIRSEMLVYQVDFTLRVNEIATYGIAIIMNRGDFSTVYNRKQGPLMASKFQRACVCVKGGSVCTVCIRALAEAM